MIPSEIIEKKRDGNKLSEDEIQFFVKGYCDGKIEDYQMSALLMAIFFRGMSDRELVLLTDAYVQSGKTLDLSAIPAIKVDKHSTGGVGDKISIILAPLVASFGVVVPMISGRALGHTGGTLDKLESIPGFKVDGSIRKFKQQLEEIGVAIFGQTAELIPADRKIYALRDVTATVNSIPLMVASIMGKKLAEGIDGLVLDVKYGNGAFILEAERAEELAKNMIKVGNYYGKEVTAFITSMEQPLGYHVGNWLEIKECLECLRAEGPADIEELLLELSAEMLVLAGKAQNNEEGKQMSLQALKNGQAFEKFLNMVRYQMGETDCLLHPDNYPGAKFRQIVKSPKSGFIEKIQTRRFGMAAVYLGAGRSRSSDSVDAQAGIILSKKVGDPVSKGEPVCEIHTNNESSIEEAVNLIQNSVKIGDSKLSPPKLIRKRLKA
jgi:pyrimidine-nucleoside phosphorylase